MKKQHLFMTLVLVQAMILSAFTNSTRSNYLNRYSEIAITEMQRSNIPASITLAQGILESAWGQGKLAAQSNNHFGIKCKKGWDGPSVPYEDDDYDENGKLTKSCFRAYHNPYDSYRDHTDFLMNRERYAALFELHPMDYIGWAKGLKACGYATAPDYAERLIRIIEENELYLYDVHYIKENEAPITEQSMPHTTPMTEESMSMLNDEEDNNEEYLDIVMPSTINRTQRQQKVYTEIYTTNQTPEPVIEMEVLPVAETPTPVFPVQIAKPVIFKPTAIADSHQAYELQVFAAPKFDISRFIQEQEYMPSSKIPVSERREEPSQRPNIETVIATERLMNIPQHKKRTQQSKRGITLKNIKLR